MLLSLLLLITAPDELYRQGEAALELHDYAAARDTLAKVATSGALARSALAEAWAGLGQAARARQEAEKAFQLAAPLPAPERILVEARYHEINGQLEEAIALYRSLSQAQPANVAYGSHLAILLYENGRANEARAEVDRLRKLP